jgi:hypothetical protein
MTPVGKSLVFYFKYWSEMQRLCEGEGGDLEGLAEPEKTREMAQEIGDKASRQAADLLEACAGEVEEHFKSIGKCLRMTSRKIVERKWSLTFSIWPKNKQKPAKPKMAAGMDIVRLDKPELLPWVWRLGGDEAEQRLEYTLREKAKVRSQELDWDAGSVGLKRISLLPDGHTGFDVDRDPIISQVREAFRQFHNADLDALWPK